MVTLAIKIGGAGAKIATLDGGIKKGAVSLSHPESVPNMTYLPTCILAMSFISLQAEIMVDTISALHRLLQSYPALGHVNGTPS